VLIRDAFPLKKGKGGVADIYFNPIPDPFPLKREREARRNICEYFSIFI